MNNQIKSINSISYLLNHYDGFLIDQWGVLHNGHTAHDGAVEALKLLKERQKKVVILSNSGKRADYSQRLLNHLGFSDDLFDAVITSGEAAHLTLKEGELPMIKDMGKNFLIFWGDQYRGVVEGLGYHEVEDITKADFIICAGVSRGRVEDYDDDLAYALNKKIPMLCTNPDIVTVTPDGDLAPCPGGIAMHYENMGGDVLWFGKPRAMVYEMCQRYLSANDRVIGIGDSLEHDIKGALDAGHDACLVTTGIHKDELSDYYDDCHKLAKKYGLFPQFSMAEFKS